MFRINLSHLVNKFSPHVMIIIIIFIFHFRDTKKHRDWVSLRDLVYFAFSFHLRNFPISFSAANSFISMIQWTQCVYVPHHVELWCCNLFVDMVSGAGCRYRWIYEEKRTSKRFMFAHSSFISYCWMRVYGCPFLKWMCPSP